MFNLTQGLSDPDSGNDLVNLFLDITSNQICAECLKTQNRPLHQEVGAGAEKQQWSFKVKSAGVPPWVWKPAEWEEEGRRDGGTEGRRDGSGRETRRRRRFGLKTPSLTVSRR